MFDKKFIPGNQGELTPSSVILRTKTSGVHMINRSGELSVAGLMSTRDLNRLGFAKEGLFNVNGLPLTAEDVKKKSADTEGSPKWRGMIGEPGWLERMTTTRPAAPTNNNTDPMVFVDQLPVMEEAPETPRLDQLLRLGTTTFDTPTIALSTATPGPRGRIGSIYLDNNTGQRLRLTVTNRNTFVTAAGYVHPDRRRRYIQDGDIIRSFQTINSGDVLDIIMGDRAITLYVRERFQNLILSVS